MNDWQEDLITVEAAGTLDGLFYERVRRTAELTAYRNYNKASRTWVDSSWRDVAAQVARWLHDNGEWGVGNHRRVRSIVQKAIEEQGLSSCVEATGSAGDVLVMHPLLIHAVNDARRVTFHLSSEPGAQVPRPLLPVIRPYLLILSLPSHLP